MEELNPLDNLPINNTESNKDLLYNSFKDKRFILMGYIVDNYNSVKIQADCDLNCYDCHALKVLECWYDSLKELEPYMNINYAKLIKTPKTPQNLYDLIIILIHIRNMSSVVNELESIIEKS